MTATVIPAADFVTESYIEPKTGQTMSSTIVAFSIESGKASPIRWPEVPKTFEPVQRESGLYSYQGAQANSLQGLGTLISEGRDR